MTLPQLLRQRLEGRKLSHGYKGAVFTSYCCNKMPRPRQLKEEFVWADSPRGFKSSRWQQAAGRGREQNLRTQPGTKMGSRECAQSNTGLETPDFRPRDILLPTRPHLLNFPKWCSQLGTNYPDARNNRRHFIQTTIQHQDARPNGCGPDGDPSSDTVKATHEGSGRASPKLT